MPVTVRGGEKKKKVGLISFYYTRGMPIATCQGQFRSKDLWLKYNTVLIFHDAQALYVNCNSATNNNYLTG